MAKECRPCSGATLTHLWWVGIGVFVSAVILDEPFFMSSALCWGDVPLSFRIVSYYATGANYVAKADTMFSLEANWWALHASSSSSLHLRGRLSDVYSTYIICKYTM